MPNPKRRHSKARTHKRRAHDFLKLKSLSTCPQCHEVCEVWTRVMGYHRPVSSFNIGKKGEHAERTPFREEAAALA